MKTIDELFAFGKSINALQKDMHLAELYGNNHKVILLKKEGHCVESIKVNGVTKYKAFAIFQEVGQLFESPNLRVYCTDGEVIDTNTHDVYCAKLSFNCEIDWIPYNGFTFENTQFKRVN